MSIWYITILSVSDAGEVADYRINNIFQDFDEMLDWFAYDLSSKNIYSYSTHRYETVVENQNLTGLDTTTDILINYYGLSYSRKLRNIMLYDVISNSIIDIRKYQTAIISHIHTAKYLTDYQSEQRKHTKQYRTHKKHYGYKHSGLRHSCGKKLLKINQSLAREYRIDIYGMSRKLFRRQYNKLYNYRRIIENNWKQKKIRKQWQYHKQISYKHHCKHISKYCDDSWMIE